MKRSKNQKLRRLVFQNSRRCLGQTGMRISRHSKIGKLSEMVPTEGRVFVGPTVEGEDAEYVLVASGKVSNKIPSFLR